MPITSMTPEDVQASIDATTRDISAYEEIAGAKSMANVTDALLRSLADGGYGESHLTPDHEKKGMSYLISADPEMILARHELGQEAETVLRAAAAIGRRVHVFPASRSLCIDTTGMRNEDTCRRISA